MQLRREGGVYHTTKLCGRSFSLTLKPFNRKAMDLFVRRWDPSFFKRRNGPEGSLASMDDIARANNIDIWVEATPTGRVKGVVGKGCDLCPYTLRFPAGVNYFPFEASENPRFENVYQGAKVLPWTPRHTQVLNRKSVLKKR